MLFLFGSDCLLFTWEGILCLFSKCITGFSSSFSCHGVGGLKQGSCRCDRTHQYPSCSAVNIYQAFSTNRWSYKCFGWSFYGKFKVWWPCLLYTSTYYTMESHKRRWRPVGKLLHRVPKACSGYWCGIYCILLFVYRCIPFSTATSCRDCNEHCKAAVSYTHLDVYKRQK